MTKFAFLVFALIGLLESCQSAVADGNNLRRGAVAAQGVATNATLKFCGYEDTCK